VQEAARSDIHAAYRHVEKARESLGDAYANAITAGLKKKISSAMTDLALVQGTLVTLHNEAALSLPPPKPKKPKPNKRRRTSRRRTSRPRRSHFW
jgi:hypothetical protein